MRHERAAPIVLARLRFRIPLEPVVGERLPVARVVHERAPLRTDVVTVVEETEPDAPHLPGLRVLAPERTAAVRAEALRPAVLRLELLHELLPRKQPERPRGEPRLCGRRRAGASLAARAVAVAGSLGLRRHLEADGAAHAVPGVRRP